MCAVWSCGNADNNTSPIHRIDPTNIVVLLSGQYKLVDIKN